MRIIDYIPWQIKFILSFVKVLFIKLPKLYDLFRKLRLFRHGNMDSCEYAFNVYQNHFYHFKSNKKTSTNFTMLELGPGDSLFSALIARAFGASKSYLVDVGEYTIKDIKIYKTFSDYLERKGYFLPNFRNITDWKDILNQTNAIYLTRGLSSLETIPDHTIDFIWSHAVLEHIARNDFPRLMKEFRRIISLDGIQSHVVDLRDHLGGYINHLKVPHSLWESKLNQKFGIYTNRLRFQEMKDIFQKAGFDIKFIRKKVRKMLPSLKLKLQSYFTHMQDEDLKVAGFEIVLHPK